jgi:hypothetical protein
MASEKVLDDYFMFALEYHSSSSPSHFLEGAVEESSVTKVGVNT